MLIYAGHFLHSQGELAATRGNAFIMKENDFGPGIFLTYKISVRRICHGRYPQRLSVGPNLIKRSGSGKPFIAEVNQQNKEPNN